MSTFPILTFNTIFKSVLWGGKRIAQFKGIPSQGDHIGESWELSGVPGHESVIESGIYAGKTLPEVLKTHAEEIMGAHVVSRYGTEFPLLMKLIDSADDLSIQVHPDDALAAKRHNCNGKTEMWISLDPAEGAYLYSGFSREISKEEYRKRIADNTILETLGKYYTRKGDVFFLPAGRVHSIGKGNFILEIQQSSDVTYRIYDFDRRDAAGNPRQLHIEESLDAVNFADVNQATPSMIAGIANEEEVITDCNFFTTTALAVEGEKSIDLSARDSFTIVIATEGTATIVGADNAVTKLTQGNAALIPASMPNITVCGNCRLVTTFIK